MLKNWLVPLVSGLVLTACAPTTTSTKPSPPPVIERGSERPTPEPYAPAETYPAAPSRDNVTAVPSTGNSAVVALLDRADQQHQAQDWDGAASSLERALRIEPRNPLLWHRLARLRLEQGQYDQAVQMASKSNSLARGQARLQADNWRLIAAARRAQGDTSRAEAAEQKARQFE